MNSSSLRISPKSFHQKTHFYTPATTKQKIKTGFYRCEQTPKLHNADEFPSREIKNSLLYTKYKAKIDTTSCRCVSRQTPKRPNADDDAIPKPGVQSTPEYPPTLGART